MFRKAIEASLTRLSRSVAILTDLNFVNIAGCCKLLSLPYVPYSQLDKLQHPAVQTHLKPYLTRHICTCTFIPLANLC